MHGHRGACGAIMVEKLGPYLVKPPEIVHIHKEYLNLDQVVEGGAGMLKNIGNILNNCASLGTNIQVGHPHGVNLDPLERVVGATRTCA